MLRYGIILVSCALGGVLSGYSGSSSGNTVGGSGSTGNGYGFSGSFSGGVPPNFPAFPSFDFSGFLNTYLDSFRKYHQQFVNTGNGKGAYSYSYASSSPTANAQAHSSFSFDGNVGLQDNIVRAQSGYGAPGGFPAASGFSGGYGGGYGGSGGSGGFGGSFSNGAKPSGGGAAFIPPINSYGAPVGGGFGNSFGGAGASASIGPGGVQQTAQVFPENPGSPNVNTRFGTVGGGGNGGHYSVFTSSSSHTSNLNGKPQTFQQAQTTVNDNGKITTYTAKNP